MLCVCTHIYIHLYISTAANRRREHLNEVTAAVGHVWFEARGLLWCVDFKARLLLCGFMCVWVRVQAVYMCMFPDGINPSQNQGHLCCIHIETSVRRASPDPNPKSFEVTFENDTMGPFHQLKQMLKQACPVKYGWRIKNTRIISMVFRLMGDDYSHWNKLIGFFNNVQFWALIWLFNGLHTGK